MVRNNGPAAKRKAGIICDISLLSVWARKQITRCPRAAAAPTRGLLAVTRSYVGARKLVRTQDSRSGALRQSRLLPCCDRELSLCVGWTSVSWRQCPLAHFTSGPAVVYLTQSLSTQFMKSVRSAELDSNADKLCMVSENYWNSSLDTYLMVYLWNINNIKPILFFMVLGRLKCFPSTFKDVEIQET